MKELLVIIGAFLILIGSKMLFSFGASENLAQDWEAASGAALILCGFAIVTCVSAFAAAIFFSSYFVFYIPSLIAENWGFLTPNTLPDWVPWAFGFIYLGFIVLGWLIFQTTLISERLRLSYGLD